MSIEKKIVSAAIKSRSAFSRISSGSDIKDGYSPYTTLLLGLFAKWYERDSSAERVDVDIIEEQIRQELPDKNANVYVNYLRECSALDVSAENVAHLVLEGRKRDVGGRLAEALLNGDDSRINDLREEYNALTVTAQEEEEEEYNNVSIASVIEELADDSMRIKLLPKALNDAVKGKTRRGHHILIYARPETGKTALTLTFAYGLAYQGLRVLIFGNEEPVQDTILRGQCCFTGMTEDEIKAAPEKAQKLLDERGWHNLHFIPVNPGTPAQFDRLLNKYKPDAFIVDQIRNIYVKADTRVNQLEAAATSMRNLGKKHNVLAVSVTQAGDSADEKIFLDMGDVDFSNTGIPAAVDLMVGMGVTKQYEQQSIRGISLPKNKIGGLHGQFLVKMNQFVSRVENV